jgi:hypothetical protein
MVRTLYCIMHCKTIIDCVLGFLKEEGTMRDYAVRRL